MKDCYLFHPQLILRAPARPFATSFTEDNLAECLRDERFMEALYLASPALVQECRKWQAGELTEARKVEKLRRTLARYYVRTTSRCTPFGLFAGCGVVQWGAATQLTLAPEQATRHTRLDMHYLCALAQQLAAHAAIRPQLRYWPNSSLYAVGDEIRYVEYDYQNGERVHQISAVETTPYLQRLLAAARPGLLYKELVASLLANDSPAEEVPSPAEVVQFVEALIDAQVLVHELEPTVTGEEFFVRIQAVLACLGADATPGSAVPTVAGLLNAVQRQLAALDQAAVNTRERYEHVVALLTPLGVAPESGKLFQTDVILGLAPQPTLDNALQVELLNALEVLAHIVPPPDQPRLDDFRRRFQARYEDQEVPLLEALDNESGLSYTAYGRSSYAPLVHDLLDSRTEPGGPARRLTEAQQHLGDRLAEAARTGQYSVAITRAEVSRFASASLPLPPSLPVVFRVLDGGRLLLESAAGSSAVNLLGRFGHAAPAVEQVVRQITTHEQHHNPAVAFAEICHLPTSRVGNVLLRHSFRALEIPYLTQSALPTSGQVPVQDLLLSVRAGQLVLRARTSGQIIIPRLSTAHNFTGEALPVYQFLCDLQTQGLQSGLSFSWRAMAPHAKFLPRLTYQNVVLEPATWHLTRDDVQMLLAAAPADFAAHWQAFRLQWQLPNAFTLAEGDNELLIEADNELLVRVWLDAVQNLPTFRLKEFLLVPAASPLRDVAGHPYAQQFIGLLLRQGPSYAAVAPFPGPAGAVPREFALGSEWLYYKLYCGQKVADRVLLTVIRPLTQLLTEEGLIDNWFFIRFADPDNHLRLRLHLTDTRHLGRIIALAHDYLHPLCATCAVWKVQTDTYRRELERYGARTIELAEALFGYQSAALLALLAQSAESPADEAAQAPAEHWLWGVGAIEELLNACLYPLDRKVLLLQGLREAFAQEFGLDKSLRLQLDTKYRVARPDLEQQLARAAATAPPAALRAIGRQLSQLEAAGQLEVPLAQLLGSFIHMLLNRLLPAEARRHELVLYDFLWRYYGSQQSRQR